MKWRVVEVISDLLALPVVVGEYPGGVFHRERNICDRSERVNLK